MTDQLDMSRIPEHIAIIMDGNGRWATERGKDRSFGHQAGVDSVRNITTACSRMGVKFLTLYTFSTENWGRPMEEVATLMSLVITSLEEELFKSGNVRFRVIGDRDRLPKFVLDALEDMEERTKNYTTMTMTIAFSYSSRWEITRAVKNLAQEVKDGKISPEDINEQVISSHLLTDYMPDPELLIRTGGELRISNYLLWQIAYSELYFCDTYWPDFDIECLRKAIINYQSRQRRFGKTEAQVEQEAGNAL